jgi:hypothetical protein
MEVQECATTMLRCQINGFSHQFSREYCVPVTHTLVNMAHDPGIKKKSFLLSAFYRSMDA